MNNHRFAAGIAELEEAAQILGDLAERQVSLRSFTTFRIGGPAEILVHANSLPDLDRIGAAVARTDIPVLVVGQGSNLLVADAGFTGVVVVLGGAFCQIDIDSVPASGIVKVGAGVKLPVLARQLARRGYGGLEWMVGVPGSVGGAVKMNAGGHGSDIARSFARADVWNVEHGIRRVLRHELDYDYRSSNLEDTDVVIAASFSVTTRNVDDAEQEIAEIVRWRREHQPGGANCGSVFTNPPNDSAGRLIDAAGLRGMRRGSASVSEKHANFIQADDSALASDVWGLVVEVRRRVFEFAGVVLSPEVRTVGFDSALPVLLPRSSPTTTCETLEHP